MNEYEELLDKASACLRDALKIEDPVVRANVLALVYHSQQVAQAAILREIGGAVGVERGSETEALASGRPRQ